MKKLDRSLANTPACLGNLSYTTHSWQSMHKRGKGRIKQVWAEIDKFQERFCVYCEGDAFRGKYTGHIEHFFDKGSQQNKPLTFDWNNLFGCCPSTSHCGHYKDAELPGGIKRVYNSTLLLKPDIDDPDEYLQFLPSGELKAKQGISEDKEKRATETIIALNLRAPSLISARKNQIERYQEQVNSLMDLLVELDEDAWEEYEEIKQQATKVAYRTAIKHAVQWV